MKQLDVDMSPSANIMSHCLSLTYAAFDLDPGDLTSFANAGGYKSSSSSFHLTTDRWRRDRQKPMQVAQVGSKVANMSII